jgi:signal transduction histidine kinase
MANKTQNKGKDELKKYKRYVYKRLHQLSPILQKYSLGNFAESVKIPKKEDEFTELIITLNLLGDDLRELARTQKELEKSRIAAAVAEAEKKRAAELEMAKNELEKAKTQLEELNKTLEHKVEARTRELVAAQEKLVRSERLAAIGQLASSVAHELRNPLGVMKNVIYYLNMLEIVQTNGEVKENLEVLSKEIEIADKVITDILEFSRIKKPALKHEDINLIVKEVLGRVTIPQNVKIATELDETLPEIDIDRLQILQVFYNLITNAIQAMEKGGTLKIKSYSKNHSVEISFIDSGVGIPKEYIKKIFDPLFSTKAKGTGLGLSVSASLIEGHEGKIEVKSEVKKGSTFTVSLPKGGASNAR